MEQEFKKAWDEYFAGQKQHLTEEQALVHERYALANRDRSAALLDTIGQSLQVDLQQKRILDVGSAYGGLPILAAARGAEAYGVEILEYLHRLAEANRLNEPGNITLINTDLMDREVLTQLGPKPFDIIILNDVFEHVYDTTALFNRIDRLSNERTVLMFAAANWTCWQAIEREAHRFAFGLTLLEPGSWSQEIGASFNIYYRPFSYYQLFCNSIGFSHLYLFIDTKMVETAKERVVAKFDELESRVVSGPFRSYASNQMAKHRFRLLRQQLAEDLEEKSSLYIHLNYDLYIWQGFASKKLIPPLENTTSTSRITFGTPIALEKESEVVSRLKKRVVITIDVEASPHVQSSDHVDRLIWGRFGNEEVGIRKMMDIAERYGHKLTFFVDYCESFVYPGAFQTISREIVDRGHDLQLHAHMEFLPEEFWEKHGLKKYKIGLSELTRERAEILFDFLLTCASEMGGKKCSAFRGGNFRFNNEVLLQMGRCGIDLSFNYNIRTQHQPNNEDNLPLFKWSNGVYEFPIANLFYRNTMMQFDFNLLYNFDNSKHVYDFVNQYFDTFSFNSIAVMMMHSWSFCYNERPSGFKIFKDYRLAQNFETFLTNLPDDVEIVTATQLHELIKSGELATNIARDVELVDRGRYAARGL